jgi:hypothetical protein
VAKVVGQETQQRAVWYSVKSVATLRQAQRPKKIFCEICGKSCWSGDTTTGSLAFCEIYGK